MGKAATNISIVLGLITIAFAGFWLYSNKDTSTTDGKVSQTKEDMLRDTQQFAQYSQTLNQIKLDTAIFEDSKFNSLRIFTTEIKESGIGRNDPFADTDGSYNTQP